MMLCMLRSTATCVHFTYNPSKTAMLLCKICSTAACVEFTRNPSKTYMLCMRCSTAANDRYTWSTPFISEACGPTTFMRYALRRLVYCSFTREMQLQEIMASDCRTSFFLFLEIEVLLCVSCIMCNKCRQAVLGPSCFSFDLSEFVPVINV